MVPRSTSLGVAPSGDVAANAETLTVAATQKPQTACMSVRRNIISCLSDVPAAVRLVLRAGDLADVADRCADRRVLIGNGGGRSRSRTRLYIKIPGNFVEFARSTRF
jgi:hypothetical protein